MPNGNSNSQTSSVGKFTDVWSRTSQHMINSFYKANRATLAAFGVPTDGEKERVGVDTGPGRDEIEDAEETWGFERSVHSLENLEVGDVVEFTKTITEADVHRFALASGDTNPLHLDDEFADSTRFGDRIAHGTLVSGLISAALARLPGMVIYLSQDTTFLHPVDIGDTLTATCEIVEKIGDGRYRLITEIIDEDGEKVIEGEAIVLIDELPENVSDGVSAET